jgi:hypothetical protein
MRRVFFASAEEFDYLSAGLSSRKIHLAEFLEEIGKADETPEGKRLQIMQHINDRLRPYGSPPYLAAQFEVLAESAKQCFTT